MEPGADAIEWVDAAKDAIELFRSALSLSREVQSTLPKSEQAEAIAKALDEAEKKAGLAEAQIAKALGFTLCRCTLPPQIMLFAGADEEATEYRLGRVLGVPELWQAGPARTNAAAPTQERRRHAQNHEAARRGR